MRMKKEIDALTAASLTVAFPQVNDGYGKFVKNLRAIVSENIGYSASQAMEWDEYDQYFFWEIEEYIEIDGDLMDSRLYLKRTFSINPRKPIEGEIERIQAEYTQFQQDKRTMRGAMTLLSIRNKEGK